MTATPIPFNDERTEAEYAKRCAYVGLPVSDMSWWSCGDKRPAMGWWAPGPYICLCNKCNVMFLGDKRAVQCADCAYERRAL